MGDMVIFWLAAMIILIIVEAIVPGLVSIWFALGALAALICALLGAPVWLQILCFLVVSVVTLILTKPLVRKYQTGKIQATNADTVIGRECVVIEEVNNVLGTGAVTVDGKTWTARNQDEKSISGVGEVKKVVQIEGVKLIIE
ncbi:MAG: NfeD family protein [Oscillospiraceae bacterium]|nr:NfeD family protein [Oscillospiraceae bacterium]